MVHFSQRFFKVAAICAYASTAIWLTAWIATFFFDIPADMEADIALRGNFAMTLWAAMSIAFLFPLIVKMWGVAGMKMDTSAGLVLSGMFFVLGEFLTELIAWGVYLLAWDKGVVKYLAESDVVMKTALKNNLLTGLYDTSNSFAWVGAVCLIVWSLLFGMATWKGKSLEKVVSLFLFVTAIWMMISLSGNYGGPGWLIDWLPNFDHLIWAALNFFIGAWLWKGKKGSSRYIIKEGR